MESTQQKRADAVSTRAESARLKVRLTRSSTECESHRRTVWLTESERGEPHGGDGVTL